MANLVAVTGKTPYGTLITHGFTLDEQGRKMSKSIGNTIVPSVITHGGKVNQENIISFPHVLTLSRIRNFGQPMELMFCVCGLQAVNIHATFHSDHPSLVSTLYNNDDKRKY